MPPPRYLYKILDAPPDTPLPDTLPPTKLDTNDGFIHLSTAEQTPITAKLFFSQCSKLWIVKLRRQDFDGHVEYSTDPKAGVEDGCAHVFNSVKGLGRGNIEEVIAAVRKDSIEWTEIQGLKDLEH